MTHGVIHLLEPVEVEQEHGAGTVIFAQGAENLFERLRHLKSVGETGEGIEMRKARLVVLRALLFGQVSAKSAKPDEIIERVQDRPAGY